MSKKETLNLAKLVTSVKMTRWIICALRVQSVIFRNSLRKHSIRCEASIIAPPTSLLEMRLRRSSQDKGATQNRPCAED